MKTLKKLPTQSCFLMISWTVKFGNGVIFTYILKSFLFAKYLESRYWIVSTIIWFSLHSIFFSNIWHERVKTWTKFIKLMLTLTSWKLSIYLLNYLYKLVRKHLLFGRRFLSFKKEISFLLVTGRVLMINCYTTKHSNRCVITFTV